MPPDPTVPMLVQRAVRPPGKCAVTHDIDGPFIDCGIKYENKGYWTRLYLHAPWVEQVGRELLKMVPRSDYEALSDEKKAVEDDLEALQIAFDALTNAKSEVPA